MPKAIDSKLIGAIERAYLDRSPKPSLRALATEFGIGLSTVKALSSDRNWTAQREQKEQGKVEGGKDVNRRRGIDGYQAIKDAIADISAEVSTVDAKSKEGCASALVSLLKAERELFPPTAEELAEMAVKLDITPADFIRAMKLKWQEKEQQQSA